MKALFYGASAASMAGLLLGMALEAPIEPASSYGQQLLISHPTERAATAFDNWMPTEGAPPAYVAEEAVPSGEDVEKALARLTIFGGPPPAAVQPVALSHAETPPEPAPYLPSRRGDILAPVADASERYDMAAVGPPRSEPTLWRRGVEADHGPLPEYDAPQYERYRPYDDPDAPPDLPPYARGYR